MVQEDSYMAATPIQPDGYEALRQLLDSVDVSPETPYSAEGYGRAQPAPEPPYGSTAVVEHHSHPYEPTTTELPSESSGGAAQVTERPNVSSGNGTPTRPDPQNLSLAMMKAAENSMGTTEVVAPPTQDLVVMQNKKTKRKNMITALILVGFVLVFFFYTMYRLSLVG